MELTCCLKLCLCPETKQFINPVTSGRFHTTPTGCLSPNTVLKGILSFHTPLGAL